MKQLLLAVLLLFACTSKAEEAVDLTGAQQAEQIIKKCTNPRWDEYKKDALEFNQLVIFQQLGRGEYVR